MMPIDVSYMQLITAENGHNDQNLTVHNAVKPITVSLLVLRSAYSSKDFVIMVI
jgi:hypothetical protein